MRCGSMERPVLTRQDMVRISRRVMFTTVGHDRWARLSGNLTPAVTISCICDATFSNCVGLITGMIHAMLRMAVWGNGATLHGGVRMMPDEARSVATVLFGLPVLIVVTLGLLQSIPHSVAAVLAFWMVMSVPFGI